MNEIELGVEQDLTAPSGATTVVVTHEWGDVVTSTVTGFTPDSIGVHKVVWNTGEKEFYDCVEYLATQAEFIDEYPQYATVDSGQYIRLERITRRIIQNYTGQKFGPYIGKTQTLQGDGGDSLVVPVRIISITSVQNNYGDDITEYVEIASGNNQILIREPTYRGGYYEVKRDVTTSNFDLFSDRFNYVIEGDWGWEYVPIEVGEAAKILMSDALNTGGPSDLRRQGVFEAQLGDFSLRLNADQWGTTGNTQADNLLADHVDFYMGMA